MSKWRAVMLMLPIVLLGVAGYTLLERTCVEVGCCLHQMKLIIRSERAIDEVEYGLFSSEEEARNLNCADTPKTQVHFDGGEIPVAIPYSDRFSTISGRELTRWRTRHLALVVRYHGGGKDVEVMPIEERFPSITMSLP